MRTFNTQAEVDAALDDNGNLFINDDVRFNCDVKIAGSIIAEDIIARDIDAGNISAGDIYARNIYALDINACSIYAWNINYYAVCLARTKFTCRSIEGTRKNSRHFCLDSEAVVLSVDIKIKQ